MRPLPLDYLAGSYEAMRLEKSPRGDRFGCLFGILGCLAGILFGFIQSGREAAAIRETEPEVHLRGLYGFGHGFIGMVIGGVGCALFGIILNRMLPPEE